MATEYLESGIDHGQMIVTMASTKGMTHAAAIRELADNSFDASATSIEIAVKGDSLTVVDDGHGTNEPRRILTPYNHGEHARTASGRYGIGGTGAIVWLADARGRVSVFTRTATTEHRCTLDYAKVLETGRLPMGVRTLPANGKPTGTTISISGIRRISPHQLGACRRDLAFAYAPAMRAGLRIVINDEPLSPFAPPEVAKRKAFRFDVDGCRVEGFCALTKPGSPNPVKGWAVSYGHRFMGVFCDPIGEHSIDMGRIYAEVSLPKDWRNINTLKDDFNEPPVELWEKVSEASLWAIEQAKREGRSIELDAALDAAQGLLDAALGVPDKVKGRRERPEDPDPGAVEPTGCGGPHRNFSKDQPGDVPSSRRAEPRRIKLLWVSDLGRPYEVIAGGRNTVFVRIDQDDPHNVKYAGRDQGQYLADIVLAWVAGDWGRRPGAYMPLFRDVEAESVQEMFDALRRKARPQVA